MTENCALAAYFARTGWSRGELARQVRARARAQGHPHVACDTSSVRRWFAGQVPRPPVGDLIADLFSDRLRLRVTTYDLGWAATPSRDRALVYDRSFPAALDAVTDLARADVDRRTSLATSAFVAAACAAPSRDWLLAALDHGDAPGPDRAGGPRGEPAGRLPAAGSAPPGRWSWPGDEAGRLALASSLNEGVYPLLRARHPDPVRIPLLAAAAGQTCLLGWSALDHGAQGTAQRYLIQALRLAQEARDAALGAHVLACMADQAILLGHPEEGSRLAQSGRLGLPRNASRACLADLCALEARAHAVIGDRAAAVRAVSRSQAAFAKATAASEPGWARFVDAVYLYGQYARVMRDLHQPSKAAAFALRAAQAAEKRARCGDPAGGAPGASGRTAAARSAWPVRDPPP
jgi:hypothetical protein